MPSNKWKRDKQIYHPTTFIEPIVSQRLVSMFMTFSQGLCSIDFVIIIKHFYYRFPLTIIDFILFFNQTTKNIEIKNLRRFFFFHFSQISNRKTNNVCNFYRLMLRASGRIQACIHQNQKACSVEPNRLVTVRRWAVKQRAEIKRILC